MPTVSLENYKQTMSQTYHQFPSVNTRWMMSSTRSNIYCSDSVKVAPEQKSRESSDGVVCKLSDCDYGDDKDKTDRCPLPDSFANELTGDRTRERINLPNVDVCMAANVSTHPRNKYSDVSQRGNISSIDMKNRGQYMMGRVLIVDDAVMSRKMLRRLLESRFNTVDEAENGQRALDMVRALLSDEVDAKYDVITMDYQMPVMDGVTATRHIRQIGYKGQIIGITGNALGEDVNTFLSSGADVVLTKPLTIAAFDEYLRSLALNEKLE